MYFAVMNVCLDVPAVFQECTFHKQTLVKQLHDWVTEPSNHLSQKNIQSCFHFRISKPLNIGKFFTHISHSWFLIENQYFYISVNIYNVSHTLHISYKLNIVHEKQNAKNWWINFLSMQHVLMKQLFCFCFCFLCFLFFFFFLFSGKIFLHNIISWLANIW